MHQSFFKNRIIYIEGIISLLLNGVSWFLLVWKILPLKTDAILHYSIYLGIDRFGPGWQVLILPLTGSVLFIINNIVAYVCYKKNRFLSFIFSGINILINFLLLIASSVLVLVNI